jgi:hypothetical protein
VDDRRFGDDRWQVAAEQEVYDAGVEEPQQDVPRGAPVKPSLSSHALYSRFVGRPWKNLPQGPGFGASACEGLTRAG